MKRFFSIFLTLVFIFTNVGYSLATHYCRGEIYKQGLFFLYANDLSCGMDKSDQHTNCAHHGSAVSKKHCCEDDWQIFQITDDYTSVSTHQIADADVQVSIYSISLNDLLFASENFSFEYYNYRPPLLQRDISVLVQSFLL